MENVPAQRPPPAAQPVGPIDLSALAADGACWEPAFDAEEILQVALREMLPDPPRLQGPRLRSRDIDWTPIVRTPAAVFCFSLFGGVTANGGWQGTPWALGAGTPHGLTSWRGCPDASAACG